MPQQVISRYLGAFHRFHGTVPFVISRPDTSRTLRPVVEPAIGLEFRSLYAFWIGCHFTYRQKRETSKTSHSDPGIRRQGIPLVQGGTRRTQRDKPLPLAHTPKSGCSLGWNQHIVTLLHDYKGESYWRNAGGRRVHIDPGWCTRNSLEPRCHRMEDSFRRPENIQISGDRLCCLVNGTKDALRKLLTYDKHTIKSYPTYSSEWSKEAF